jgi:hypothetical protein
VKMAALRRLRPLLRADVLLPFGIVVFLIACDIGIWCWHANALSPDAMDYATVGRNLLRVLRARGSSLRPELVATTKDCKVYHLSL